MRTPLRSLSLGLATVLGLAAFAQPLPPYDVTVAGYVAGCTPNSSVNIITVQGTQPAIDIDVPLDANCGFSVDLLMDSYQGWFMVSTPCGGAIQSATGTYTINSMFPDSNVVWVMINCTSGTSDCLGVPGGTALPGTPCTNFQGVVGIWAADCTCDTGTSGIADCLGIINGPNVPGAPCQSPATGNGYWSANCVCVPDSTTLGCQAGFWVFQAYTIDSLNPNGTATPIPNELWIWNLSSGVAPMQFLWSFGDGTSSTEEFPTHFYANGGPYLLCLTLNDASGCTSTSCDSIAIDGDGLYTGMILEESYARSGFTINVIQELPTGLGEQPVIANTALWPNPVAEELNLTFNTSLRGSVPMSIIDLDGRTLSTTNVRINSGTNRVEVPVNGLAPGMYLVRFGAGDDAVNMRFVKR